MRPQIPAPTLRRYLVRLLFLMVALVATEASRAAAQVAAQIAVYPEVSSLEATSTRPFSAYVPISPSSIVWLVNGVAGGQATLGTITSTGLYRPPAVIPTANVLTISARSTAFPSSVGNASLTITRPYPWLWSASPSSIRVGAYTLSFNGSNFAPDSEAVANGSPVPTTYVSPTKLTVSGTAAATGTLTFAVRQPGPGAVTGSRVTVQVTAAETPPAVSVSISPASASVPATGMQAFAATVTGPS